MLKLLWEKGSLLSIDTIECIKGKVLLNQFHIFIHIHLVVRFAQFYVICNWFITLKFTHTREYGIYLRYMLVLQVESWINQCHIRSCYPLTSYNNFTRVKCWICLFVFSVWNKYKAFLSQIILRILPIFISYYDKYHKYGECSIESGK